MSLCTTDFRTNYGKSQLGAEPRHGHTAVALARALVKVNPERPTEVLQRRIGISRHRVTCSHCGQSDLDAVRFVTAEIMAQGCRQILTSSSSGGGQGEFEARIRIT